MKQISPSRPIRFLIADQDRMSVYILERVLEKYGLRWDYCSDNKTMLEQLLTRPYSCLCIDLDSPSLNAEGIIHWINEEYKRIGDRPFLFFGMTSSQSRQIKTRYINWGVDMLLEKPLKIWDTLAFVQYVRLLEYEPEFIL